MAIGAAVAAGQTGGRVEPGKLKPGDTAMVYSMFGWKRVPIVAVRGAEYLIRYPTGEQIWVKASSLRVDSGRRTGPAPSQAPSAPPRTGVSPAEQRDGTVEPGLPVQPLRTPELVVTAAADAGKYDIVGIKLGMGLKQALLALKAHNGNFQLRPQSVRSEFFPQPLTYGISALPLNLKRPEFVYSSLPGVVPPNSEALYFFLTMPPSEPLVWKLSRLVTFDKNTAPMADTLVGDLLKKYGSPSWDDGPTAMRQGVGRRIFWIDDRAGKRTVLTRETVHNCASLETFKIAVAHTDPSIRPHLAETGLQMDAGIVRARLQQGSSAGVFAGGGDCFDYTMVQALAVDTTWLGIATPGLAGGLLVTMSSGPLDRAATDATHAYLVQASKDRDAKRSDAAKQNRPKL